MSLLTAKSIITLKNQSIIQLKIAKHIWSDIMNRNFVPGVLFNKEVRERRCMMGVISMLEDRNVEYKYSFHPPTYCAQRMAQVEHVHGMNVAKPVIIKADGRFYMCVLAACCKINFNALKSVLQAENVKLANEQEIENIFQDCEVGAEPPFGSIYGLPTLMDDRLEKDEYIVFQGGTHENAVKIKMSDYIKIESPMIYSFSYHI